ncbi:hypothetical protein, partial [Saccharibacter sp. EH70]
TPFGAQADSGTLTQIPPSKTAIGRASLALGFPKETFTPIAAGGVPPYGEDMNGILNMLSQSVRASEAGLVRPFSASYAQQIGGYPRGSLVSHPNDPTHLFVSIADNNGDDPTKGSSGSWSSLTNSIDTIGAALTAETQRAQAAEAALLPLSGGTMSGALFSGGTFSPSENVYATQPVGAALSGEQFYLQLVNDNNAGTTWGRLVLRDGGGNFHVPIQIDNHGHVTDAQGRDFLTKPEAQAVYLPLSGGNLTGSLYSTGTFQQGSLELTQPVGAALADEQFFLQLVNETKNGTTWGRLVLRDGGGNFHVPIQVDNHDNTTVNGTLNVTGQAGFQSSVLSQGTFQQGDLQMTMPIGAGFWDMQFFLQLANNAKTGTTTGRLVLKDNGGNYFVALQIDNHGHVTDAQGRDFLTKPEAQAAYLPLSGGNLTGALYSTGTFQQGSLELTQPVGAALADEQFFLQLVNETKNGTTWGRLVLRDGGGNFHVPIQVDNHDNTTV